MFFKTFDQIYQQFYRIKTSVEKETQITKELCASMLLINF